jgi:hypothetical protein
MVKMRQNVRKFRPILEVVTLVLVVVGMVALAAAPAFASPDGGDILFEQPPDAPGDFGAVLSDAGAGLLCLDDFWDVTNDIRDIHWYGFSMDREAEVSCNVTGIQFEIIFYRDSSGSPGAPVATFSNVTPAVTVYADFGFGRTGYHFEVADLGTPVSLTKGWVSIQSTYSPNGCFFNWLTSSTGNNNGRQLPPDGMEGENLAFALSAAPTPPPPPPSPAGVPTVNHWGIVAMITLFAGLLVWTVRRRRLAS